VAEVESAMAEARRTESVAGADALVP